MPVVFCENINRKIEVSSGDVTLREALLDEGVRIYPWPRNYRPFNCGGNGLCTTCAIEVVSGLENLSPPSGKERSQLKNAPETCRLSCQCSVNGDITIRVRPSSC